MEKVGFEPSFPDRAPGAGSPGARTALGTGRACESGSQAHQAEPHQAGASQRPNEGARSEHPMGFWPKRPRV